MTYAWLSLGSNLTDPVKQVQTAISELEAHKSIKLVKQSSLYKTKAVGKTDQADFINAVVAIKTRLDAKELLVACQAIENKHDRVRKEHWGPRTLDIDVLLFGKQIIKMADLTIPHPVMHKRAFVLVPLTEINEDLLVPGIDKKVSELLDGLDITEVKKISDM